MLTSRGSEAKQASKTTRELDEYSNNNNFQYGPASAGSSICKCEQPYHWKELYKQVPRERM